MTRTGRALVIAGRGQTRGEAVFPSRARLNQVRSTLDTGWVPAHSFYTLDGLLSLRPGWWWAC